MDEIKAQRKLGKQLLLVRLLKAEAEKAEKTGLSLITKDDLANWASMSTDEIEKLIKTTHSFEKDNMAAGAAIEFEKTCIVPQSTALFAFLRHTYLGFHDDVLRGFNRQRLSEYCINHSAENYKDFPEMWKDDVGNNFGTPSVFETVVRNYLRFFVSTVDLTCHAGYDWDVISEMLWCNISKEDYDLLAQEPL